MPPTPTLGPPTPSPTPPPTSPFAEEDFPPYIELPARPIPEPPAAARPLARALVSISLYPPADYDSSASQTTGLLVSPDGLVLTVLDYTRPMRRIEVVLTGGTNLEASIERVDPRTGATLLSVAGSDLPYVEIARGDPKVSPGEPVLLLGKLSEREDTAVYEGYAAPAINDGAQEDMLFALLPIGNMGSYGTLVVNREGRLLGTAGLGQWRGAGPFVSGPAPGPPQPAVKRSNLLSLLEGELPAEVISVPAAVSFHGQNSVWGIDGPATRELLSRPAHGAMNSLGGPEAVGNLGQTPRSVLGFGTGTVLEMVYARPQELRDGGDGELLGMARYVAFWWDREDGRPNVLLCGAEPEHVGDAFLANDLEGLKTAAASAPASGRSMVDFAPPPGYPSDYPLKGRVRPSKETYLPGKSVEFVVTIENLSDWPMTAYNLPPVLEVRTVRGPFPPFYWWRSDSGGPGDRSETVPPHQELKLVIPWHQVDHDGKPMPPGEYTIGSVLPGIQGARFIILEE